MVIGDIYRSEFCTYDAEGELANADDTPTGTLVVNGSDSAASVTITNPTTGRYKVSVSLAGLSNGDICYVRIVATVDGVTAELPLPTFRIDAAVSSRSTFDHTSHSVTLAADQSAVTALGGLDVTGSTIAASGDWLTSLGDNAPAGWINANAIAEHALDGKGDWTVTSDLSGLSTLSAEEVWEYAERTLTERVEIDATTGWGGNPLPSEAEEVEVEDVVTGVVGALAGQQVTITTPYDTANQLLTIVRGDSYLNADGRAITISIDVAGTMPNDISDATVALKYVRKHSGAEPTVIAGDITTAVGNTKVFRFDLTSEQTGAMELGRMYNFEVEVLLEGDSDKPVTPVSGEILVVKDLRGKG